QMSYSDYGMVYSFTMGRSNTATVTFDYPISGTTQLGGAPAFTQRIESTGTTSGTYTYSVSGGVSTITRPDTSFLALTDNGAGLLAQAEIKLGAKSYSKMSYTYASDPGGSQQVVSAKQYDDTGTAKRIDYGYDQFGNITSVLEYGFQVNGTWQVQRKTLCSYEGTPYTTNHILRLVTAQNLYDPNNNQIAGTSYAYDGYGGVGLEFYSQGSTAPGHLSNYDSSYTLRGNLTSEIVLTDVTHGTTSVKSASYDVFGNVVQIQLNCCNQKSFTYSQDTYWSQPDQTASGASGGPTLSNNSSYNFNTSGMSSQTDPNGLTTTYSYGNWLNPTQIDPPGGAGFSMGYDDWGTIGSTSVSYTDAGTNKSFSASATKDGWGSIIQQFDAFGDQINLTYDSMGRLVSKTNPFLKNGTPGPATRYQYDPLGRVTLITLPNNNTVSYNFSGSTVTVTDQVGRKKQTQNDGLGRLLTVTEEDPVTAQMTLITNYAYDLLDDPIQIVQRGQTRAFRYDALGEMLYQRMPEQAATISDGSGGIWSMKYTYTGFGSIASIQDSRGVVTTNGYDSLNRPTSVSYNYSNAPGVAATNNVTYTYDNSTTSTTKGLLLSVTMTGPLPTYQEAYSYDSLNRVSSRTLSRDGQTYKITYQYNTLGQLTTLTYPSGRAVNVNHDSQGRLSSLTDPSSGAKYFSNITFSPAGQFTADKLGNGTTEAFGYDTQTLQLISQTATAKGGASGGLLSLNYSYQAVAGQLGIGTTAGNAGQMVSIANSSIAGNPEIATYNYDPLRRLATSTQTSNGTTAQRRFSYDGWGNRTGEWDATTSGNQIQSVALQQSGGITNNQIQSITTPSGSFAYSYDAAGNVSSDGVHTYQYDAEDRLASVDNGNSATYAYDFRNLRVRKTLGTVSTHYIWEGGHVIAEHNGSTGAQITDYVFAGDRLIGEGAGASFNTSSTFTYQIADRLSERLSIDQTGLLTELQGHLPFGEDFAESGTQEKHHFTSYERDPETGDDYAQNRQYSPGTGRFLQVDPAASVLTSKYVYSNDDPINEIDMDGLLAGEPPPDPNLPELFGPPDPSDGVRQTPAVDGVSTSSVDNGYLDFSAKRQGKIDKRVTKWLRKKGVTDPSQITYYLNAVHNWPTDIGAAMNQEINRAYAKFQCGPNNPITSAAAQVPRNGVTVYIEPTAMTNPYYNPNNPLYGPQYVKGYYDPNTNGIYVAALIIEPGSDFYSAFLIDPVDQGKESGISYEFENYIAYKIGIPTEDETGHPGNWPCDQHMS
ncbi:MAG: RHS repeat domain-containing protein, partial [Blastocatellia bacterium]